MKLLWLKYLRWFGIQLNTTICIVWFRVPAPPYLSSFHESFTSVLAPRVYTSMNQSLKLVVSLIHTLPVRATVASPQYARITKANVRIMWKFDLVSNVTADKPFNFRKMAGADESWRRRLCRIPKSAWNIYGVWFLILWLKLWRLNHMPMKQTLTILHPNTAYCIEIKTSTFCNQGSKFTVG